MHRRPDHNLKNPARSRHKAVSRTAPARGGSAAGRRARFAGDLVERDYSPPETWHEPKGTGGEYEIVVEKPGRGFRHVVTEDEIRERLAALPKEMTAGLEVIQLSQMTRKKKRFPCYGMQWGSSIYLYPIETSRIEVFTEPPGPSQRIEARMYGARWEEQANGYWHLVWTDESLRDFYLNNVLIHELGHLLDQRNTTYRDRERFAEWFAVEHGYKPSRRAALAAGALKKLVVKRHHK